MIEKARTLGLKKLWIIILLTVSTQCLWITLNAEATGEVIPQKNYNLTKCLKIDVTIPYIQAHYGILTNEIISERTNYLISQVSQGAEEYQKMGYSCAYPYEVIASYKIAKQDENLLSLYIDYYQFAGGAHGMSYKDAYTIDKKNGNLLKIKDLFNPNYDYKSKIDNMIREEISTDKEKYFDVGKEFKGIDDKTTFYLTNDSLVIYYGLYEIAPYASGIIEFKLDLNNFKDGLKYGKI